MSNPYQDQLAALFDGAGKATITSRTRHIIPGTFLAKLSPPKYEVTRKGPGVFTRMEIISFRGATAIGHTEAIASSQVPDFWYMPGDKDVAIKIMMGKDGSDENLKALGLAIAQQLKINQGGRKEDVGQEIITKRLLAQMCDPAAPLSQAVEGLILAFRTYHHRTGAGYPWTNYEYLPQSNPQALQVPAPTADECTAYMAAHSDDLRRLTASGDNALTPSHRIPIVLTYAPASITGAPDPLGLGTPAAAPAPATAPAALGGILGPAPGATAALTSQTDPLGLGAPAPAAADDPLGLGAAPAAPTRQQMIDVLRAKVPRYASLDFSTLSDAQIAEGHAKVAG